MTDTAGFDHDLFVIGGGSGGVRAARIAASEGGASVGLAEQSRLGGTCVIRGCVPKKLMVFASGYPDLVDEAAAYGWKTRIGAFDWRKFRTHLHEELSRLEGVYRSNLQKAGVTIHDCRAVVEDPHTVRLEDGTRLRTKHILVATGGHPTRPDMPGCEEAMVSDDIFDMKALPESILIIGGGYIGCEFACILAGLGVKVTQYLRGAQILRGFDEEARGLVAEAMRERGIDIHSGTTILEVEKGAKGFRVKSSTGREETFGQLLFATGRAPNTDGLGLEAAGVKLGRHGEVMVDKWSQSSVPSIFAVGDVTDRIALTPVAIREGHAFADTVFGGRKIASDHDLVASAVFTQPELGSVGMTEEEAAEKGAIEVYCSSFRPMRTAFIGLSARVMMKLVVCADTRRVLGCHIVAPEAGEMIQMVAIAIKMGATKEDFDRTVAVHPTMGEEMVTMREPIRKA